MSSNAEQVRDAAPDYRADADAQDLPVGYRHTEVGVIPEDWDVRSVRELGTIRTGPFGTLLKAEEYSSTEGVPLISVGEIGSGALRISEHTPRIPPRVTRRLPQYVLRAGDIVFGRKGAVDRSALVAEDQDGWFLGSDGICIRPADAGSARYIAWQFLRREVQAWLLQNATGTTMASLNQAVLSQVRIPYAPAPEQRAIAEALSDVDGLLGALEALIAKKRAIKRAAMQQLVTGRTRLPGFSGQWETKRLGDCLLARPGYGINAPAVAYSDRLPTYIRITDITDDGCFSPEARVSVRHADASRYYLTDGDLVFARTGASVGKSYLYRQSDGDLVFAGFLIRVQPDPTRLVPAFLFSVTKTSAYWNWVRQTSMRSGQPGINGNEFADLLLSLPSIPEQTAIATALSDMDAEIAALEARRDKTRAIKQGMMQQLLTGRVRLVKPEAAA